MKPAAQLAIAMCLALLAGCSALPKHTDFSSGVAQNDIRKHFGEPQRVLRLTKTKDMEHAFGPVEDLWYRLEIGDRVELWQYKVKGGTTELYFVNGAQTVTELAFGAEGVVY